MRFWGHVSQPKPSNLPATPLGATRLYLSDADWQPVVTSLLQTVPLVVLVVGNSRGVRWELETAVRVVAPERLLLVITPDSDLTTLREVLPKGLPKRLASDTSVTDIATVTFDEKWESSLEGEPCGLPSRRRSWLLLHGVLTSDKLAFAALSVAGFFIALQFYSLLLQSLPGLAHYW